MCVALPARVIQLLEEGAALVEQHGRVRQVSVQMVPDVQVGEFVLLNLGAAVQKLRAAEAREIQELWRQISLSMTGEGTTPAEVENE